MVAKNQKQIPLPGFKSNGVKHFGGTLIKGNPREARPISTKRPLHLVMRSSLAVGERSFLRAKRDQQIRRVLSATGKKLGVKVYRVANSGNHLHIVILPRSRQAFHSFIRAISGLIARITLGVERGRPKGLKFWDARPFTRILEWGKDYQRVCEYLVQNSLEALGFIPYRSRVGRLRGS